MADLLHRKGKGLVLSCALVDYVVLVTMCGHCVTYITRVVSSELQLFLHHRKHKSIIYNCVIRCMDRFAYIRRVVFLVSNRKHGVESYSMGLVIIFFFYYYHTTLQLLSNVIVSDTGGVVDQNTLIAATGEIDFDEHASILRLTVTVTLYGQRTHYFRSAYTVCNVLIRRHTRINTRARIYLNARMYACTYTALHSQRLAHAVTSYARETRTYVTPTRYSYVGLTAIFKSWIYAS